jgi:two-component system cell cycle response regulator CpdR
VTDIVMPGMDGIELARAATARRPELKVLLMTGFAAGRTQAHESAHGFLSKPFSLVTVCATVDDLLQGNGG